jgi:hypothetical protein
MTNWLRFNETVSTLTDVAVSYTAVGMTPGQVEITIEGSDAQAIAAALTALGQALTDPVEPWEQAVRDASPCKFKKAQPRWCAKHNSVLSDRAGACLVQAARIRTAEHAVKADREQR